MFSLLEDTAGATDVSGVFFTGQIDNLHLRPPDQVLEVMFTPQVPPIPGTFICVGYYYFSNFNIIFCCLYKTLCSVFCFGV